MKTKWLPIVLGVKYAYWKVSAAIVKALWIRAECAWCGKILRRPLVRGSIRVSHSICPVCAIKQGMDEVLSR